MMILRKTKVYNNVMLVYQSFWLRPSSVSLLSSIKFLSTFCTRTVLHTFLPFLKVPLEFIFQPLKLQ